MRLGHVGLAAKDPRSRAVFYARFLGLRIVGEAPTGRSGAMVSSSSNERGAPDLQLMSNPRGAHVAFQVDSLAELRSLYAAAPSLGAEVVMSLDHGPTLSFYVRDPDGNTCEVCWATGRGPGGRNRPIDLARPEEDLLQLIGS